MYVYKGGSLQVENKNPPEGASVISPIQYLLLECAICINRTILTFDSAFLHFKNIWVSHNSNIWNISLMAYFNQYFSAMLHNSKYPIGFLLYIFILKSCKSLSHIWTNLTIDHWKEVIKYILIFEIIWKHCVLNTKSPIAISIRSSPHQLRIGDCRKTGGLECVLQTLRILLKV